MIIFVAKEMEQNRMALAMTIFAVIYAVIIFLSKAIFKIVFVVLRQNEMHPKK